MPKKVKYIGTESRWSEAAATGKQSVWEPGWMDVRSDVEAAQLLATGLFFDVDATILDESEITAVQALVSGAGVANGTLLAEVTPNTVLTDTDTTMRQLGFLTIPGGKMGLRTRLEIGLVADLTGNDSKNLAMRAGPASGTFATATAFGGLTGLSTQKYTPLLSLLWNNNSLTEQRANPIGQGDWPRANTGGASLAPAIDTSLDWNIYVGFQSAVSGGAPTNSATLRTMWVRVIG